MQAALLTVEGHSSAASLLKPIRQRILALFREPNSASAVATSLGMPRQRVGYHVRALERDGLLRHVGDQRRGNCVERLLEASARRYVLSPRALGTLAAEPDAVQDRFSTEYLLAVAAKTLSDVSDLQGRANAAGKKLPTLTLQTVVRFGSPADQNAFAEELADATAKLVKKYHREDGAGRSFQFVTHGFPAAALSTEDVNADETL